MNDVHAVGKAQTADMGRGVSYQFRGVDAVVNAVGPALRAHGVTVLPKKIKRVVSTEYETKTGGRMVNREVTVLWQVRGPQGDTFTGESVGEGGDTGDKGLSKAQSVAYRVFLLQALCIPTGDRDPDYDVHERASRSESAAEVAARHAADWERGALLERTAPLGWDEDKLVREYWERFKKNLRNTTDVRMITAFGDALVAEGVKVEAGQGGGNDQNQGSEPSSAATLRSNSGDQAPEPITQQQSRLMHTLFSKTGMAEREKYLKWCSNQLEFTVTTTKNLTSPEAAELIEKLQKLDKEQRSVPK